MLQNTFNLDKYCDFKIEVKNPGTSFKLQVAAPIYKLHAKGQLISECLFDFLNFPKKHQKVDKFLPKNLKSGQINKLYRAAGMYVNMVRTVVLWWA